MIHEKKIIIFAFVLLVGVGVFFLWKIRTQDTQQVTPVIELDKARETDFKTALQRVAQTDKDFDGLSDDDEKQNKTNPDDSDTDGDGLSDWQEVSVYKTNPLDKDTDKDTYVDGYEVRRGFNPNGAGRL